MDHQAEVGAWIAAHIVARIPIGGRFGVANCALPIALRLESGEGLDDIAVSQDDGGHIDIQAKTKADLSNRQTSPLGKTIGQLARSVLRAKAAGQSIDPVKQSAALAVIAAAPRTLDNLESGCRAFDTGGTWAATKAQRSNKELEAIAVFESLARAAWGADSATPPSDSDLVEMARLFHVVRFSMNPGEDNWREASQTLGRRLYGSESAGDAPLRDLKEIVHNLIGSGAPADRAGLLRELRRRGHVDVGAPDFEPDLARLAAVTRSEIGRLAPHTRLPIDGGVLIRRQSDAPLAAAVSSGSLIVIGEPGAGKTGALVRLAQAQLSAGDAVFFLSVDRFPGVAIAADLQSELALSHPLIDVLSAAPGNGRKLLIIDALDAARGGPAEGVFAQLIESILAQLSQDWIVVASIRTFDLRNGRRYRSAMPGMPPDGHYADPTLGSVRHFLVPRLSDADLSAAGAQAPLLGELLTAAPDKLRDLLRNVFNLSLAAQLLTDGANPASIRTVATQSDLIDAYEDRRLDETVLQQAAAATVDALVQRRRLAVRKVVVAHPRLDDVIRTGVLADGPGDLVSFSHHVLFDHVAGRFFLEWDDQPALLRQLIGDTSTALMLAPALRFAIERYWRSDSHGKSAAWQLVAAIYASTDVDPVLANVALRTAGENVSSADDVVGLCQLIESHTPSEAIAKMLSHLARFVGIDADSSGSINSANATAWATVAEAASATGMRTMSDPAAFLLRILFDKADLTDPLLLSAFGRAARSLLVFAWEGGAAMQQIATNAIRFVGRSFASDAAASRVLLDRILRDPHFSAHADREAPWLAEQITPIAASDPSFAVEIFKVLYSRDIADDARSYLGGQPSRILPLATTRSQDYRHCRWNLGRQVGEVLRLSAHHGTRAVIEAALGDAARGETGQEHVIVRLADGRSFRLVGRESLLNAWDDQNKRRPARDDDALLHYVTFLRNCPLADFSQSAAAAASDYSSPGVWSRLFGIGSERVAEVADVLWPYATNPILLTHANTMRDAVRFLAAAYPGRSAEERAGFEVEALRPDLFIDASARQRWRQSLSRLLSLIDAALLATEPMRNLRAEMENKGELSGNPPLATFTTRWGDPGEFVRDHLMRQGVNVEEGPDAQVVAQSDALNELIQRTPPDCGGEALAGIWGMAEATIALYDTHAGELNEAVEQPVWGHISSAVARIAQSAAYMPGAGGMPTLAELLVTLRRLWKSRHPAPRDGN